MIYAIIDAADILEIAGKFPCDIAFEFPPTHVYQSYCCKESHNFKMSLIAVSVDATEDQIEDLYLRVQFEKARILTEKPADWMSVHRKDISIQMC